MCGLYTYLNIDFYIDFFFFFCQIFVFCWAMSLILSTMQTDLCVHYGFCLYWLNLAFSRRCLGFLMAGASGPDIVVFVVLFLLCLCFSCVCFVAIILQPLTILYNFSICLASNLSLNNVDNSMNFYFLN